MEARVVLELMTHPKDLAKFPVVYQLSHGPKPVKT